MQMAKDLDVDKMQRLIDMLNSQKALKAKQDFDLHFAEMQKDYIAVGRDKSAKDGAKVLYKYAPLESILKIYQPIISRHGFSYKWSEETVAETKEKRIFCHVSGYGHTESVYIDIPIGTANTFANAAQQRGITSSYGKRYSFIAAFGVIIEDEDDDAQSFTFEDGVQYAEEIKLIRESQTMEELAANWKIIYERTKKDDHAIEILSPEKDKRKKALK
jgi:ERF superfamily